MNIVLKGAGLLALLVLIGAGCVSTEPTEEASNDDSIIVEDHAADDAMDADSIKKDGDAMIEEDGMVVDGVNLSVKGEYVEYAPHKVSLFPNANIVLFFHASWCPSCKALDNDITSHLSDIPKNLVILKTNYDTEKDLKKKYGVTYQHTLVQVDTEGNMIKKWSGGNTFESVVNQVN